MTTALNAPLLFGNSSKLLASNPVTAPKTVHTSGNAPLPPIPTFHPDRSCSFEPSLNDNGGKPNTPPLNSLPPVHHPTQIFRQLLIKLLEGGSRWVRRAGSRLCGRLRMCRHFSASRC